jgi:2-haloacid dehalogenase
MKTIVFDVNETLLDLQAMRPRFDAAFGSTDLLTPWFGQLLRHSLVATLTDTYTPFDVLGVDALRLVSAKSGIDLPEDRAVRVVDGMRYLPPHPEVRLAITRLRDHGFRIATLTNSPPHLLADQLANAEITDLFDVTMSVDPVHKFKPHPDTYRSGAKRLGVGINDMRLVAAHDWDVTGAIRAGAAAAFVARPGMVLSRASETPDIVGPDLDTVAAAIIDIDG